MVWVSYVFVRKAMHQVLMTVPGPGLQECHIMGDLGLLSASLLAMQGAQVVGQNAKQAKQQYQTTLQSQEAQGQQQQQQGRRKLLK